MANREVNLTKRVNTADGMRSPRGPVREWPCQARRGDIDGHEARHPEGAYYIEWYEGSRRRRLSVGKNAADANARRLAKEAELNAANHGVPLAKSEQNGHTSLTAAVADYLEEIKLTKKYKTHAAYTTALNYFTQS